MAESQFNLGRAADAKEALEKGLKFSPRNPAAHALRGFLLSAENNLKDAKDAFETAITLHSALGDAWLGHGLCLIKQGQVEAGRRDLMIAAALEPNRPIFRRYLSENFSTVVSAGTPTPKKLASRPEKTSRGEKKTASSKPQHAQTTARPNVTPTQTQSQPPPLSGIQIGIGIGRGQRYTSPPRNITPPPRTEGSGQGGQSDKTPPPHTDGNQGRHVPRPGGNPIKKRTPPPPHVG